MAISAFAVFMGTAASLHFSSRAAVSAAETEQQTLRATTAEQREEAVISDRFRRQYIADMRDAKTVLDAGDTSAATRLLDKYRNPTGTDDPRAFEWHYLDRLARSPSPIQITRDGSVWSDVALDSTGDRLACTDQTGRLAVFGLPAGDEVFRVDQRVTHFAFSNDGATIVALGEPGQDRIIIFDSRTGAITREIPTGRVTSCMAIKPDDSMIFLGSPGNDLDLWSLKTLVRTDLAKDFKAGQYERSPDIQNGVVTAAAFQHDGPLLAIGYENGVTQVWDTTRATIVSRGPPHTGDVTGLSFSSDGTMVASISRGEFNRRSESKVPGEARIWDAESGRVITALQPHKEMIVEELQPISGSPRPPYMGFRPCFILDDKELITTGALSAQRWSIDSGKLTGTYPGGASLVHAVSVSADGRFVAAADVAGSARVWPVHHDEQGHVVYSRHRGIRALCGDGNRLAVLFESALELSDGLGGHQYANTEFRNIAVWSLVGQKAIQYGVTEPDADTLAVAPNALICGKAIVGAPPGKTNTPLESILGTAEFNSPLAVSFDGRWVALGFRDGTIRRHPLGRDGVGWTVAPHEGSVTALAFSRDGALLASGGSDRRIYLLNAENGAVLATLQGHSREVAGIAFSPDGRRLASGSGLQRFDSTQPGEVLLWDVATYQLCSELIASTTDIYPGVAWSGDGRSLFAGASNAFVEKGDMATGRVLVWSIDNAAADLALPEPVEANNASFP